MDQDVVQDIVINAPKQAAAADEGFDLLVEDEAALSLPTGAVANEDGSVTLTLDYPVDVKWRRPGSAETTPERFTVLTLHRLLGAEMRRVLAAKGRAANVALALSAKLTEAKIAILQSKMDASDVSAASAVVAALCGFTQNTGLPDEAVETDAGPIELTLRYPAEPDGFDARSVLVMRRLKGEDLQKIAQAKDTLPTAIACATGLSPREANALFDVMDASDIMAAQRVISFLSGNGRTTGR